MVKQKVDVMNISVGGYAASLSRNDQDWVVEPTLDGFYIFASLRDQSKMLDLFQYQTGNGT